VRQLACILIEGTPYLDAQLKFKKDRCLVTEEEMLELDVNKVLGSCWYNYFMERNGC
jgi:hypothetical protein